MLTVIAAVWMGCLIAEAFDDFRSTRRLAREVVRQWTWVWRKVAR